MSKIIATGAYLPGQPVSNQELINQLGLDSSDEWISQRTGIKQRYFAQQNESVADIAIQAAKDLLEKQAIDVSQIHMIIVATMSAKGIAPSVACQVQTALEIPEALAFDISGACSGFVMAMEIAEQMTKHHQAGYTLLIGAEKMSQILNLSDRSTAILFGDGAGAVLIENDGQGLPNYKSQLTTVPDQCKTISVESDETGNIYMSMIGRDVFNFVNRTVVKTLKDFVDTQVRQYDYLISHQANQRLLDIIEKKLTLPVGKVASNIDRVSNTSAGSIPILLNELVEKGQIKLDGSQTIVVTGFGGGLSYGHACVTI